MNIVKLGWKHLRGGEKFQIVGAVMVGTFLAYNAATGGYGIWSNQGIGPLVLTWGVVQSLITVGIIRMRSFALNHIFVETLKELRDASNVSEEIKEMLAKFLGDKK